MNEKINRYGGPDHWYNPKFFEALHRKPVQYLSEFLKGGERILDIGAGDGKLTYLINQLNHWVVGLESQWLPIRFAKLMYEVRNVSQIPFVQGDAISIPFKKCSFEVITLFDVIEHVPPEMLFTLLNEMKRVLKVHGKLILTTPNRRALRNRIWGHRTNPKHYKEYDVTELKRLLVANEFGIEALRGIFLPVPIPKIEHYGGIFPMRRLFSFFINLGESYPSLSETIFLVARR